MSVLTMPRLPRSIAAFLAVAGVAGAFAAAAPSHAAAAPLQNAAYDYNQMPDIDQKRSMVGDALTGYVHLGLPGNGDNYCGPTASMNAIGWMAQNGAPNLAPGVRDWQSEDNYETATANLSQMGSLMKTDAAAGTREDNLEAGLDAWSAQNGNYFYGASFYGDSVNWAPDMSVPGRALQRGAAVIFRLGWYAPVTKMIAGKTVTAMERTGGHWVTMTGYGPEGITFVDPADTADYTVPSPRTHVVKTLTPTAAIYGGTNADGTPWTERGWTTSGTTVTIPQATYLKMNGYTSGTATGYIEGYTVMRPNWTLSLEGVDLKYTEGGKIHKWPLPSGNLADAQVSPAGDAVYYAMKGSRTLYKGNTLTGTTSRFAAVSAPITRLRMSGDRILAASGSQVTAITSRGTVLKQSSAIKPDFSLQNTIPAAQLPAVQQAPVVTAAAAANNPHKFDTAVETPSLLSERVIRRSAPIHAKGIDAKLYGS
jgi:hypothetical protein